MMGCGDDSAVMSSWSFEVKKCNVILPATLSEKSKFQIGGSSQKCVNEGK